MKRRPYEIEWLMVFAMVAMLWQGVSLAAEDYSNKSRLANNQNVETLLKQFEQKVSAETANKFLDALIGEEFIDEPILFSVEMPVDSMQQQVYYWAAEWLYDQQQYKLAEQYALRALPLFHPTNDSRADCLNLLGIIYVRQGDFKKATEYAKQCLEMDMKSGDDDRISSSMNTVAGIYMAGYQAQEAEHYIIGALDYSEHVDNLPRRAVILGMASEVYHSLGDDDKALSYSEQAYLIDSLLGREPQTSIRLSQKGAALLGLHRYQEAETVYRRILPTLKRKDVHSYAIALNRLGMSLQCQEQQREAIPYYIEAADLFSQMNDLYNELHSCRGLYESYWKINPDSAKLALDRFNLLKDSLYTHSTAETLSRYNAEFSNDQLKQENYEVRQSRLFTIIICVLLLFVVVAVAWLVILHLNRRYQKKMHELVSKIENEEKSPHIPAEKETQNEEWLFLKNVIEVANTAMINGNLSVEQVASDMNMGVQSFRRKLQSATGETPKAYFTAIQMERAVSLFMESPTMPLSRVAKLCGFEDASSFGHTFRRIYGCSPSQYRQQRFCKE